MGDYIVFYGKIIKQAFCMLRNKMVFPNGKILFEESIFFLLFEDMFLIADQPEEV